MIDTHCHLEDYENLDEIVSNMGKNLMIASATNKETCEFVLKTIQKYPNVYGTLGIHPENIEESIEETLTYIEKNIKNPKIVAIGEIGLDYYWTKENKEKQQEIFRKQLLLAKKYHKPVVIHCREAVQDTYNILKEVNFSEKIVLHCYSSSIEMAYKFMEFPVMFGIGGVVTFKNSHKIKEFVKEMDLNYLLLETDSPYLTPEPYRGKTNEPYNIYYVALKIAEIKGIKVEEVFHTTTRNAIHQFDIDVEL